jgi:S-adenosylmethionine decarboxylase
MWRNLEPRLTRQRLVIEATTANLVEPPDISKYLLALSKELGMKPMGEPETYATEDPTNGSWSAINMGYAGWMFWVSSGAHVHTYPTEPPLFTVDIYTCSAFSVDSAVDFTKSFIDAIEVVWAEGPPRVE